MPITDEQLKQIIEAAIMASAQPMTVDNLMALFAEEKDPPTREAVKESLKVIAQDCENRGVELKKVSSGYRFQARQEFAPWVSRLWEEKPARYSRALLETLVLIAYKQPITRGEIEHVRGVAVSTNIIKTLLEREWVRVVGHRDVPGKPALYATTKAFLDYFNLTSLEELPTLAEIRDLDKINTELGLEEPDAPSEGVVTEGKAAEGGTESEGDTIESVSIEDNEMQGEQAVPQLSDDKSDAALSDQADEDIQDSDVEDAVAEAVSLEVAETSDAMYDASNEELISADADDNNEDIDSNLDDRDVVVLDEQHVSMDAQLYEDEEVVDDSFANLETVTENPEPNNIEAQNIYAENAEDELSNDVDESQAGFVNQNFVDDHTTALEADATGVQGEADDADDDTYPLSSEPSTKAADDDETPDVSNDNDTSTMSDKSFAEPKSQAVLDDDHHGDASDTLETATTDSDNEYSLAEDYDSKFAG